MLPEIKNKYNKFTLWNIVTDFDAPLKFREVNYLKGKMI
jgi:hypothetical protein